MTRLGTAPAHRTTGEDLDLIRLYLNDIATTPLLTAAEEVALAKRIEAGVYAAELLRQADTSGREPAVDRVDLAAVAEDGARAEDHMIRANLRLVVATARRYHMRGVPLLDVIQNGNLGLIRAVEKYDHTKGHKFSTYATWWIRQATQRGDARSRRAIRLPDHVQEQANRLHRLESDLEPRLCRTPTVEELAEVSGLPARRVSAVREAERETVSLDAPVGPDGDLRLVDVIDAAEGPQRWRWSSTRRWRTSYGPRSPRCRHGTRTSSACGTACSAAASTRSRRSPPTSG
ncbi:hypothetical protein GCM10029964_056290 [Kibdelosporangium lantanae]